MAQLKFIGMFTLSHDGNQNQHGEGGVPLMWPAAFVVGWRHFHVAGRNFKEILHQKKVKKITEMIF